MGWGGEKNLGLKGRRKKGCIKFITLKKKR